MRVLGVDPGTARLGYAIVDFSTTTRPKLIDCGVIKTSQSLSDAQRLAEIRKDLLFIVQEYQPEVFAVEKLFFFKNLKTVIPVAQARGVILEVAASHAIPVTEFTPLQVKQTLTGQGRADKKLVAELVRLELDLDSSINSDDAADAVAIAFCYWRLAAATY